MGMCLRTLFIVCLSASFLGSSGQTSVFFAIQAHQDDWQLFMSARVIADMQAGAKMVFITLTAGDESCGAARNGGGGPFFMGREKDLCIQLPVWRQTSQPVQLHWTPTATTVSINGHNITKGMYIETVNSSCDCRMETSMVLVSQ